MSRKICEYVVTRSQRKPLVIHHYLLDFHLISNPQSSVHVFLLSVSLLKIMVKLLSVSFVRQSRFIPVRLLFRHILTRTDTLGTEKHSAPLPTSKEKKATTKISAPLSLLPLGLLIKSYLISFLSSSPLLLTPSLRLLSIVANSRLPFLDPDRNPILRYALKKTIYSHFCAGENLKEVRKTTSVLKALGYSGVILAHGREIVLGHYDILKAREKELDLSTQEDVEIWKQRNLSTVRLVGDTDLVALKYEKRRVFSISNI